MNMSICLSICLSIYLSIYLYKYMYIYSPSPAHTSRKSEDSSGFTSPKPQVMDGQEDVRTIWLGVRIVKTIWSFIDFLQR